MSKKYLTFIFVLLVFSNVLFCQKNRTDSLAVSLLALSESNLQLSRDLDKAEGLNELLKNQLLELSISNRGLSVGMDSLATLLEIVNIQGVERSKLERDIPFTKDTERIAEFEEKIFVLRVEIENLMNSITEKNEFIKNQKDRIFELEILNDKQQDSIEILEASIKIFETKIEKLHNTITDLNSKLNCAILFASEQLTIRQEAENKLYDARTLYETIYPDYKRDKRIEYDIESIIDSVVTIYLKYQTSYKVMQCDGIPELEYSYDNLTPVDDYYLMRIYAFNEGNVVDKLNAMVADGNGRQKSVSLALSHLGKVMEKGNYDDKKLDDHIITELFEVMNNLGFYIIPSKTKNSDQVALEKVIEYYNKGKYDAALSQYNKYERYISSSNTSLPSAKIQEIQFKIASIVIWQLAPISRDRSIYPKSSWLYRISGNPVQEGLQILHELMSTEDLDPEVRRDCIITKTKMYA